MHQKKIELCGNSKTTLNEHQTLKPINVKNKKLSSLFFSLYIFPLKKLINGKKINMLGKKPI